MTGDASHRSGGRWFAPGMVAALACGVLVVVGAPATAGTAQIQVDGSSTARYGVDSTTSLVATTPGSAHTGDVLVASLGVQRTKATKQVAVTAPAGWTLASRTNYGTTGALLVFVHSGPLTSSQTWTTSAAVGGTVVLTAYAGVDPAATVVSQGTSVGSNAKVSAPSLTATAGSLLVAGYVGYVAKAAQTTWSTPTGMTRLADVSDPTAHLSMSVDTSPQASAGSTGARTATASRVQSYAIGAATLLKPLQSSPAISTVVTQSVGTTSATIGWVTDAPADSQVDYGPTTTYGSTTAVDPTLVTSHAQTLSGLTPGTTYHYRVRSRDGSGAMSVSPDSTFTTTTQTASGPVPLIVDTDMFSDADDAGALATAFGLQIKGEAKVVAINVNTRTSRPAVAASSWGCVDAIAAFYGAADIPIGSDAPMNGTEVSSPDWAGPCAAKGPQPPVQPQSAVTVYRQALASQPDGSAVIVSIGFMENLAALLQSPPDSISSLSGADLVAQKVKSLVIMGGRFPSGDAETNLAGNVTAAKLVTTQWPTKIVWAGSEVGDAIHTGASIPDVHPVSSPVRAAYEAFVGPHNWIYSYDLAAVYHAVRPADSTMTEVGPGTTQVSDTGATSFSPGAGNQYYLKLNDATAADTSIENLLDTLPPPAPGPTISDTRVVSVDASSATVAWTTDVAADTQVDYGPSGYTASTQLDPTLTTTHTALISGLQAGTTYQWRANSRSSGGVLTTAAGPSFTTTGGGSAPPGPNDTFDSNTLDPALWATDSSGSTVAAVNQELDITHPAGSWTTGTLRSVGTYDQTGRSLQVQVLRAANAGQGGTTYGETSVFVQVDGTHYAEFFIAGGAITAWSNAGSGETNLTPAWPRYDATSMQWLRFREAGGTLSWETADGATSPGTWHVLASAPDPFPMTAVSMRIVAGSNVAAVDTARFDNVSTSQATP